MSLLSLLYLLNYELLIFFNLPLFLASMSLMFMVLNLNVSINILEMLDPLTLFINKLLLIPLQSKLHCILNMRIFRSSMRIVLVRL